MSKETLSPDSINRLLELGANLAKINQDGTNKPFTIIPEGCKAVDLSGFFAPQRIERAVTLLDAGSFADYVNRFKDSDTLIAANVSETGAVFIAILDYHTAPATPRYCAHKATFGLIQTPEFKAWLAANGQWKTQAEFATWLEDNASLFQTPSGADLLEIVTNLEGHSDARYKSALRLASSSVKFTFDEDVTLKGNTTSREGSVEIPRTLGAGFPLFQGAAAYSVPARLKYKLESGKVSFKIETVNLPVIIRDSILLVTKQIAESTSIVPLLGVL